MYNRYVPQPDGTYHKNRMAEPTPRGRNQAVPKPPPPPPPQPVIENPAYQHTPHHGGIFDFFRRLFPGDFDTGDLIVILLLLLMAGDGKENNSTALLTLVLYLLM